MNLLCLFKHKWYADEMNIRSHYGVPSEAFCMRCGKLEWSINGITYIPKKELKPHILSRITQENDCNA